MQINKLQDLDLSQYKLAYYKGDSLGHDSMCQDDVMALVEGGGKIEYFSLNIALIPKGARLTECSGDDWNDNPAIHNASELYTYPKGTIFLQGDLGEELEIVDSF